MKLTKKIVALVAVLMTTASVLASEVTVITMLNGAANSNVGTVTHSEANGVCTLTVTPASGYYIDIITAEKTVSGGMAQAPRRRTTPGMDNYLQVSGPQSPYDPSGETTWTFIMPEDESYSVEVIANFKTRTSIASATLNLTLPEGGYVFDGEAKEPDVTVTLGGSTLASSDYTVDYSDNINAGTATVTVTGKNTYTGTATKNFTISKAALSDLSVMIQGWIYGQYNEEVNAPRVDGNEGEGAVTYSYKAAGATEFGASVPQNAGTHIVKATIAESANYQGKEVTNTFSIAKADFSLVTIADIANKTFTGEAIEPDVTVTFKGKAVDASEYTVGYSNNINVGTATVTLTATGTNFTAETTASKTFQIVPASVAISAEDQTVTYNGDAQEFTNYNVENGEVFVAYYATEADRTAGENQLEVVVNAGTYYVQLTQAADNYTSEPVNVTFTINPKTLTEDMMWQEGDEFVYSGEEVTLADTMFGLTDGNEELEFDTDFTISYSNNVNVGTATATITGLGNYQGTLTTTFEIVRQVAISFSKNNSWMSYYAEEDLAIPHELEAYAVTGVDGTEVKVQKLDYIPSNQGVLLTYKEVMPQEESLLFHACTDVPEVKPQNQLSGVAAATLVSSLTADGSSIYVLYNDEFVKTINGTIPANRCYLPLSMNVNVNARLTISFADDDNETTSLNEELRVKNEESVDAWYDMQGRKVAQPAKGLYIVNGKKVVIK